MTFETRFSVTELSLHEMQTIRAALNRLAESVLSAKWELPYSESESPAVKALDNRANEIKAVVKKVDAAIERDLYDFMRHFETKTGV
jgi:hypothetical protein